MLLELTGIPFSRAPIKFRTFQPKLFKFVRRQKTPTAAIQTFLSTLFELQRRLDQQIKAAQFEEKSEGIRNSEEKS